MQETLHTMSNKEIRRLEVIQKTNAKLLKRNEAADILGVSTRQVIRLVKAYQREGAAALKSNRRGRKSNRQFNKDWVFRICRGS